MQRPQQTGELPPTTPPPSEVLRVLWVLWVLWCSAVVAPVLADYNLCPPIVSSTHSHTSQSVRVTFLLTNCVDFCACLVDCCRHEGSPGGTPPPPAHSPPHVCGLCQWHFKLQTTGTGNCHLCVRECSRVPGPGPVARIRASTARSTAIKQTNSIM